MIYLFIDGPRSPALVDAALHAASVDILVGTDVSRPGALLGGTARGASVHYEPPLLVAAG